MSGTNYPTSIDDSTSLPPPGPNTVTNAGAVTHALLHDNEILALQALETKLGIGSSTSMTSTVLRSSSAGTSTWGKLVLSSDVTGTLPVANGGTGVTSSTGSGANVLANSPALVTPTGIVKGDVGLGNVDNTSDATKNAAAVTLTNKTITTPVIDQIVQTSAPGIKIPARTQTDNSNVIANATTAGVYVQYGWGQILGPGTATMTEAVTFPTAYSTILGVSVSWIGFKSGGTVATDITQLTSQIGSGIVIEAGSPSTTGFTMKAATTGSFGAAYHGYSWIAWGI